MNNFKDGMKQKLKLSFSPYCDVHSIETIVHSIDCF